MQRFDKIYNPSDFDLNNLIDDNKKDGFAVKQMVTVGEYVIFLSEKETRKEKLEHLNDIAEKN